MTWVFTSKFKLWAFAINFLHLGTIAKARSGPVGPWQVAFVHFSECVCVSILVDVWFWWYFHLLIVTHLLHVSSICSDSLSIVRWHFALFCDIQPLRLFLPYIVHAVSWAGLNLRNHVWTHIWIKIHTVTFIFWLFVRWTFRIESHKVREWWWSGRMLAARWLLLLSCGDPKGAS